MSIIPLILTFPETLHPGYILLIGDHAAEEHLLRLIAEIAPHEPIGVIDAGIHFNPHYIARRIRRQSTRIQQALDNIQIVRIFHAHQFPEALNSYPPHTETLIIMGGMVLFEDETMNIHHKLHVWDQYLTILEQISATRHVVIGIKPTDQLRQHPWRMVYDQAAQLFETEFMEKEVTFQPGLFDQQEISN